MTNFINHAIKEFSDSSTKDRLVAAKQLAMLYSSIDSKLAHVGGNLNQAMRRINETAAAGQPLGVLLKAELAPKVGECMELCSELRLHLRDVTSKYAK